MNNFYLINREKNYSFSFIKHSFPLPPKTLKYFKKNYKALTIYSIKYNDESFRQLERKKRTKARSDSEISKLREKKRCERKPEL